MNVIDWMRESARYMARIKPHLYSEESALAELTHQMEYLRVNYPETSGFIQSGGFMLFKMIEEEGQEEFELCLVVSSVTTFYPEEDCLVLGWVEDIALPKPHEGLDNDEEE